jgi:multidrug efflux system membrane fusion protein
MPALESPKQEPQSAYVPPSARPAPEQGGSDFGSIARKAGLVVIILAAAAFGYWKLQSNKKETADTANKAAAAANRAIPVTAATVTTRTMPIYLTALGTVTAYNTVTVKTRVDGQLLTVPVREGQHVNLGQVLATIDPGPYQAAVAQAEGQLAKDQASADYAKAEASRYSALYDAGVVSKDSQQVQQSSAGQSAGVLDADRAAIQAAKVNLAYTRITSPIDGVVGLRQVDAGNIVHAADTTGLLVVTQLQPIAVIFTLPEDQLPTVIQTMRGGKPLVVEAYDRSESTHLATGKLLTLDNEIDTTTGTVKAKAVFDNKDMALFPNQFVNIRLILEQRADSLVMPAPALQSGSAGSFVYLVKPCPPSGCPVATDDDGSGGGAGGKGAGKGAGKTGAKAAGGGAPAGGDPSSDAPPAKPYYVDVQPVVVDLTEGSQVILKSGLKPGDQVVVDGQEKLKKYSKVIPKDAAQTGGRTGGRGRAAGAIPDSAAPATGIGSAEPAPGQLMGKAAGNAAADAALAPNGGHKHKPAQPGAPQ